MRLSGRTLFSIRMTPQHLSQVGCGHDLEDVWIDTCRACSVNAQVMKDMPDLVFYNDFNPEGGDYRVIEGVAETTESRLALSRLIAAAYGHPDPIGIYVWQNEQGEWVTKHEDKTEDDPDS